MVNKVTFAGYMGGNAPIAIPPGSAPGTRKRIRCRLQVCDDWKNAFRLVTIYVRIKIKKSV